MAQELKVYGSGIEGFVAQKLKVYGSGIEGLWPRN